MALTDWRRILELDPHDDRALFLLEVDDAGASTPPAFRHRLRFDVQLDGHGISVPLDYYALGELVDQLREAMGVLLALQGDPVAAGAVAGLTMVRDTPPAGASE